MGSFSFTRAEHTTKRANFSIGDKFKLLVPKEFGGGYIVDTYFNYGELFVDKYFFDVNDTKRCTPEYVDGNGTVHPVSEFINNIDCCDPNINLQSNCDIYGILAWWNDCKTEDGSDLKYFGDKKPATMTEILKNGLTWLQDNRCAGIHAPEDKLKFPLKMVSVSYKGTYESCKGRSYSDPEQGFGKYTWDFRTFGNGYKSILDKLCAAEANG
jgi:hypothetical protein